MSAAEPNDDAFFQSVWGRLEQIVARFEEAWQRAERPSIDAYLEAPDVEPRQLVLELAHADLECRWKAGEVVRVETYFERYPDLTADRAGALRLIEAEYQLRRRREPGLGLADYVRRFPQYDHDLAQSLRGPHRPHRWLPPRLNCPHCHKSLPAPEKSEQEIACHSCGGRFRVDAEQPLPPSPEGPPRLAQFELLEAVGQGAFGTVYRARDVEMDRVVAVKVPRLDRTLTAEDADRFVREARHAGRLSHPGIVPVYEVGHTESVPYIVSAYVEGVTLAEAQARRRLDFRGTAEVAAQIADALDHAHRQGVIHRDLKPSNIMVGRIQGSARSAEVAGAGHAVQAFVMDFGLARRDEGEVRLTLEGQILGTPAYMSPEQARGGAFQVDGRGDVYSLGVILYELLTGDLPFRGVTRMVLQQILAEEPRPPRRLNDKIPRDLDTITLKCLAKEPGRRYPTAAALAADLRRHLQGEPIQARPVSRVERCWRWAKRNPRVAALSGVILLLVATVVIGSLIAALLIEQKREAALAAEMKARQAQGEAEESAAVANERLSLTLDTLDKLVFEVKEQLDDKPGMAKLQETLLRSAVAGLERVARDAQGPRAYHSIARAHDRLGDIYLALGQTTESRRHHKQGLAIAERLLAADPTGTWERRAVCVATAKLSEVSLREGDTTTANTLCRKALELAQESAAHSPKRSVAARDLARCYNQVGKVQLQLGDARAACDSHRQAIELAQEALLAETTFDTQLDVATIASDRGDAERQLNDLPAARTAYLQALAMYQGCVDSRPESVMARRDVAAIHEKLGDLELQVPDLKAAQEHLLRDLDYREKLAAADPYNPLLRRDLSVANEKLGELSDRLNDARAARGYFVKSLERHEELAALNPRDALAARDVAVIYLKLANLEQRLGDSKARDYCQKALKRFGELAANDPDNAQAKLDLATTYRTAGLVEAQQHDYVQGSRFFEQGVALLRQLEAGGRYKDQPLFPGWLRNQEQWLTFCRAALRAIGDLDYALAQEPTSAKALLVIRARALAGRGEHVAAAATAEKLRALGPEDGVVCYDVACCYALCAAGVAFGKAPALLLPEESSTRAHYVARALQELAGAVERGYHDVRHIESDADLAPLRTEKEFAQLIARLRATGPPAAKPGS